MRFLILLYFIFALTACDSGELWRDGDYQVAWIDDGKPYLAYGRPDEAHIIVIERTVESVGSNMRYIVVSHRAARDSENTYYIVDKSRRFEDAVMGPFNAMQFKGLQSTLDLPVLSKNF
ncbi:hypothetical protein J2X32_003560 [Rheinheimera pacifica]|uniref:hypothetical protein n=1 Tax=Rheinheimera pacifica TaxID=173990 RepID=UPI002865E867|nr:hypothetical protein [Rheinheimera pacifica]MDR6984905.1 hypothetical protein [Rheinheimera pacifica]